MRTPSNVLCILLLTATGYQRECEAIDMTPISSRQWTECFEFMAQVHTETGTVTEVSSGLRPLTIVSPFSHLHRSDVHCSWASS